MESNACFFHCKISPDFYNSFSLCVIFTPVVEYEAVERRAIREITENPGKDTEYLCFGSC